MQLKHFNVEEFASPDKKGSGKNMVKNLLYKLDNARDISGVPFIINSGFRTEKRNKKVKGSPTSSHLKGLAVDISCKDSVTRLAIVRALIVVGFARIGIYETFIHTDVDPEKEASLWLG